MLYLWTSTLLTLQQCAQPQDNVTMSLEALNTPPLVAAAGVGTLLLLPILEKAIEDEAIRWGAMKAITACAYAFNFLAVQVPGRIDGMQPEEKGEAVTEKKRSQSKEMEPLSTGRMGKTLLAPSGWSV
jgi:hypothetical protein